MGRVGKMFEPFEEPIYVTRPLLPDFKETTERMKGIWKSRQLTNIGEQHERLNLKLKEHLGAEHLALFNNGTLALVLGLKALELKGEVITTPFTFPATAQALDWNNLTPVFCDIEPVTMNIDADKIEALITKDTSAILAVHVFGNPCNTEKIQQIADKHNLKVIYDGAHVFGVHKDGKPISAFGDMTMFSFHATKLFNTVEGGALAFKDGNLEEKLYLLKNFGIISQEEVRLSGLNAKMNEIQAGIGLEVLKSVEMERAKRHRIKKIYGQYLADIRGIRIITNLEGESSSYQYFVIEVDESAFGRSRDDLKKELEKYNVYTRKYFYPLCSDFDWYKNLESARPENLPVAQQVVERVLSMPYYGEMGVENAARLCGIIKELAKAPEISNQL